MIDQQAIDKLAAFCKLADKGYRRDPECGVLCEPEWVRDVPGGVEIWRPDQSDDDCRVVLEECRKRGILHLVEGRLRAILWMRNDFTRMTNGHDIAPMEFVLASPREKCKAVAKVLRDA